jgi:hypothetical protein
MLGVEPPDVTGYLRLQQIAGEGARLEAGGAGRKKSLGRIA